MTRSIRRGPGSADGLRYRKNLGERPRDPADPEPMPARLVTIDGCGRLDAGQWLVKLASRAVAVAQSRSMPPEPVGPDRDLGTVSERG